MTSDTALLIALSGSTSSGKTTVATLLTYILPSLTLVHADDFYKPDSAIPLHASGVQDWDCAEALDVPRFRETLLDIKHGGKLPEDLVRQGGVEDGVHGVSGLSPDYVEKLRQEVQQWPPRRLREKPIVLVEGFLLFGASVKEELGSLFDLKILLRATEEAAGKRRRSRNGYVTLEGFWQDPEGYFEDVVWPHHVEEHGFLFEDGDVERMPLGDGERGGNDGVRIGPVEDVGLDQICGWVVGCLREVLDEEMAGDG